MIVIEFAVYDSKANLVDSVDPYLGHAQVGPRAYVIENDYGHYDLEIPIGGEFRIQAREVNA